MRPGLSIRQPIASMDNNSMIQSIIENELIDPTADMIFSAVLFYPTKPLLASKSPPIINDG